MLRHADRPGVVLDLPSSFYVSSPVPENAAREDHECLLRRSEVAVPAQRRIQRPLKLIGQVRCVRNIDLELEERPGQRLARARVAYISTNDPPNDERYAFERGADTKTLADERTGSLRHMTSSRKGGIRYPNTAGLTTLVGEPDANAL